MYYEVVAQCAQTLSQVDTWLDKAEHFAKDKKFDINILMSCRLAPDQFDFIKQVQSACDYVKAAAAWLSKQKPPKHEDTEKTITEIRARIKKTLDFVGSISKEQYADASKQKVSFTWAAGKEMAAENYLLQMTIPNIYFHLTIAYAILRHNGVDVGKMDFLGQLKWISA